MDFLKRNYIFIIPAIAFLVINVGLDFDGFYGQDSYEYLRYTEALTNYYTNGVDPGDYFWPVMYPLISSIFTLVIDSKLVLVLISFLSFLGIIYFSRKILEKLYPNGNSDESANLYLLVTLIVSPYFFRSSIIGMSDMFACFFLILALYSLLIFKDAKLPKWAVLFVASSVLAFMTRYVAAVILIPFTVYFIYLIISNKKWWYLILSAVVAIVFTLPHLLIRGADSTSFLSHEGFLAWSPLNFFQSSFATPEGVQSHSYINLLYGLSPIIHPGYLLVGLGLLLFSRYRIQQSFASLIFIAVVLYLFFIVGVRTQNMRFFILVFPFVILLLFPAFLRARDKLNRGFFTLGISLALLAQVGYFSLSFSKFQVHHTLEKNVAMNIVELDIKEPIYAFSLDVSLPHRGVENEFRNMWIKVYDDFQSGAYVLFNEEKLAEQWQDQPPMQNWNKLNSDHSLIIVSEYDDGWKLYRIE